MEAITSMEVNLTESQLKAARNATKQATYYYYQERFALAAKSILDKIDIRGNPVRVPIGQAAISTIRLQYYQGLMYLLDNLDDTGKYKKIAECVVCRSYKDFIEICPKRNLLNQLEAAVEVVSWREDFDKFLETAAPNDKFFREHLALTDEEIAYIESSLASMVKRDSNGEEIPCFLWQVDKDHMMIIRDNV